MIQQSDSWSYTQTKQWTGSWGRADANCHIYKGQATNIYCRAQGATSNFLGYTTTERTTKERTRVHLSCFAIQQKLAQHCKSLTRRKTGAIQYFWKPCEEQESSHRRLDFLWQNSHRFFHKTARSPTFSLLWHVYPSFGLLSVLIQWGPMDATVSGPRIKNPCASSQSSRCTDNTGSLTYLATQELQDSVHFFLFFFFSAFLAAHTWKFLSQGAKVNK